MGKLPKYLFLSLALCLALGAESDKTIRADGHFFIYNDTLKLIFGSGEISLILGDIILHGDILYYDVNARRGILYGGPRPEPPGAPAGWDIVFFQGSPPRLLYEKLGKIAEIRGDPSLRFQIRKPGLQEFKDTALFFEFSRFEVNHTGRVRAEFVIPYIMGLPSMPLKQFTLNRGEISDRSSFTFKDVNYSQREGLSLDTHLRLRLNPVRGDFSIKAYERGLFKLSGIRRGLLYSGQLDFQPRKTSILVLTVLGNTGDKSFNLSLSHEHKTDSLKYRFSQQFSGRSGAELFTEFRSWLQWTPFSGFSPELSFRHNWESSYSYRVSAPIRISRKLKLRLGLERRIIREAFQSDQMDVSGNLDFQSHWFSLTSGYRINRDMINAVNRRNFSTQLTFTPIHFFQRNISLSITPFYLFNSFPSGEVIQTSSSPGIRFNLRSLGLELPLGLRLEPAFHFHHLWDGLSDDMTDFQTNLVLSRDFGPLCLSTAYSLASRFRSKGFWVEGNHTRNLHLIATLHSGDLTHLQLRFTMDNDLKLETCTWNGRVRLPWRMTLSSFAIYYIHGDRFQTVEIFLEKTFKRKLRIQGGYSLALKKIFLRFLLV